jgi:hypothetical protein
MVGHSRIFSANPDKFTGLERGFPPIALDGYGPRLAGKPAAIPYSRLVDCQVLNLYS